MRLTWFCLALLAATGVWAQSGVSGYYRTPVLYQETLVFVAEGDLWTVPLSGGLARRLTTHPAEETHPVISPDGRTLAFTARYEGPAEVYTMPLAGGLPERRTYDGEGGVAASTFAPNGDLVYATSHYSTLPDLQLVRLDLTNRERSRIPLSQASEASFDASGKTLYFVRPAFHNNVTRWYSGGWARQIWRYSENAPEAEKLTGDHAGESHSPMWWNGRVYLATDRDGTMNLWSMTEAGKDLRQHTKHSGMDVRQPALHAGRIVYAVGADIWVYDIGTNDRKMVPITLASDLDQLREKWVTKPMQHLTAARLHPDGESLVLTSRGRVFVAPAREGRWVQVSRQPGVRYRDAVFMPDGKSLLALSDASGELEFAQLPINGIGAPKRLTSDGKVLRFEGMPSPDGAWIAYTDNNNDAWLFNVASKSQTLLSRNREGVQGFAWSPDSRHVAFSQTAPNSFQQILIYDVQRRVHTPLTSDRANSHDAVWSTDGKWIYFLSDRNLNSVVGAPWGPRQPDPFFDKPYKIYQVALRKDLRSPFKPADELSGVSPEQSVEEEPTPPAPDPTEPDPQLPAPAEPLDTPEPQNDPNAPKPAAEPSKAPVAVKVVKVKGKDEPKTAATGAKSVRIDYDGLAARLYELPVPAGDYNALAVNDKAVYWLSRPVGVDAKAALMVLEITNRDPKQARFAEDVRSYDLSRNGKRLVLRKDDDLFIVDAGTKALTSSDFDKGRVKLGAWSYPINVREDWRQIYLDAWRLERDYFYDPGMHGVDWNGVREKYLPLVERVTTRDELSDVIGLAVGELSALHTAVREGDLRRGNDDVKVATLGARLVLDRKAGGYRIDHIYRSDPDYPDERSPLADPELRVSAGDVITMINGTDVLTAPHPHALLRNQAKQQVLLRVKSSGTSKQRDVVVTAMTDEANLRYTDWEQSRRQHTDELSNSKIGYVHLRAMTPADITAWYRNFYPVFNRQGLIIDVRHNRGGNIDSFLLGKLLRKDWMYWQTRAGEPYTNMQYAFRGHMVVLVNEQTASDGEAFAEGFRRLGLGKVIGSRTWGGEIWLGSSNRLSDGGYARAPSAGVYGAEGKWLIEQHGVDPDIVVDNLPHATFKGEDAQLDAAIKHLQELITKEPRPMPAPPPYPVVKPIRSRVDASSPEPGLSREAR
jgi:tricorn protease